jgi:peroxiredoxin
VKKLADKPFALIGVNGNDARKLKEVMDKEKLTWRSFADAGGKDGTDSISAKWNVAVPTTLYVIDHRGVIRHKWLGSPGEKAIDEALDRLIKEAEADARK